MLTIDFRFGSSSALWQQAWLLSMELVSGTYGTYDSWGDGGHMLSAKNIMQHHF